MKNKLIFTAILTSILLVGCGNDASKQEIGNDKEKTNENFVSKPIKISAEIKGLAKGQKITFEKKHHKVLK